MLQSPIGVSGFFRGSFATRLGAVLDLLPILGPGFTPRHDPVANAAGLGRQMLLVAFESILLHGLFATNAGRTSTNHARPFGIKLPTRNQELHGHGIVPRP
jgi:hypothetical protein